MLKALPIVIALGLISACGPKVLDAGPRTATFDGNKIFYTAENPLSSNLSTVFVVGLREAITQSGATFSATNMSQESQNTNIKETARGTFVISIDAVRDDVIELKLESELEGGEAESSYTQPLGEALAALLPPTLEDGQSSFISGDNPGERSILLDVFKTISFPLIAFCPETGAVELVEGNNAVLAFSVVEGDRLCLFSFSEQSERSSPANCETVQ